MKLVRQTQSMKRLSIASVLLLFSLTSVYAARPWTFNDDVSNGIPVKGAVNITTQNLGIGHLQIHIADPVVKMEQVELNKRDWTMVTIDGETRMWQNGKPALPLIARAIRLPNTGNVQLVVTPGEYEEYQNIDVLPQQPTDLKKVGKDFVPIDYTFDADLYAQDQWYPSQIAGLTDPQIVRDARIALLGVQPVIYNPVTRTLRVYKTIDIETIPIGGAGTNELLDTRSHAVPTFAGIYSEILGCDDLFDAARNAAPGKILIICRPGVASIAQPFADWKTQSGHPCQVITTMLTSAQAIHDSIIMPAYNNNSTPLETVLLVGDGGTTTNNYEMPAFTWAWTGPYAETVYSDNPYGCISTSTAYTSGILASWWSGRFSATSDAQFQTMMNRTLNYERTPYFGPTGSDTAWYNYAWGYAGISNNIYTNPACIRFCLQAIRDRGVTNIVYDEYSSSVSDAVIDSRLNGGALFWPMRASWVNEIQNTDVDGITNTNKPWVGCNVSCYTGEWYGSGSTGIQEEVTRLGTPTAPRGALSSVSTQTDGTNPAHNNVTAAGTFYALYLNARQPGTMYFQAKYQLWRNYSYGDATTTDYPSEMFILANNPHGDLSVNFWTGVPHALTANIPTAMSIGQNRLDLTVTRATVPVSGALVTAWKKNSGGTNETYVRGVTDDSGRVVLTLTNATAGNMLVTVTGNQVGQNYIPLIDTVTVAQSPTDLAYSTQTILDDSTSGRIGNNNGAANPGETIDLNVQLMNRGTSVATGISGTLVSNDSRISVINATRSWGNDSAGTTVATTSPFRIQLMNGFKENDQIPLQLNLTTNQGNRTLNVPITVHTIKLNFVSVTLNPTTISPGQTGTLSLTVSNNGTLATGATSVNLFTLSPSVLDVTSANATFTGLPIGANASNPAGQLFTVSANGRAIRGSIASLGATFTSGANSDTVYFTTTVGTRTTHDPAGPESYGYLAYDITDTAFTTLVPTYQWVEIIPGHGGTGARLPITDNTSADYATVVRLPFTANYYGASYDSLTICNNGWVAFGAQRSPDAGHAPFNNSRNWHLPAHEGPKNMVAVNWCDQTNTSIGMPTYEGTYIKSDTANHQYIVTWSSTTVNTPAAEEYQLIIYDPVYSATPTGDSPLKFQYKTFHPTVFSGNESGVSYATIGIADSTYTRALEYCYWNVYDPGCATIPTSTGASNFAILYTTARPIFGNLSGTVTRASDNQPIPGANVLVISGGRSAITDSTGHYTMSDLQISHYSVQVTAFGYNSKTDTATIYDNVTSTLNFVLTNPTLRISVGDTTVHPNDSIAVSLHDTGEVATQRIIVRNTGNGPLTWSSDLLYSGSFDELDTLWNPVTSINVSQIVGDNQISGVEFDGTNFWASGANNYQQPHHLYKLDRNGVLLHTYNCPDATGLFGWRALAWDGQYLYGSYSNHIDQIGTDSAQVVRTYPVSINPARAIAVDTATGTMYYCDQASPIYKLRMSDGAALGSMPNPTGGGVYGLSWYPNDPDGKKLYAFVRDSTSHTNGARIYRINAATGASDSSARLGAPNENACGICVTPRYNPLLWTLASVLQSSAGCRIALFELSFNSTWISFGPRSDSMQVGQSDTVSVALNSRFMPDYRYRVGIRFNTNSSAGAVIVPVIMNVVPLDAVTEPNQASRIPKEFSLEQNYPNPFNPVTSISFSLPRASVVKFTIYDQLGRQVAQLVGNQSVAAGRHTMSFDGSRLASGVYFYRLEAGSYVATRKMLLLK